MKLLFCYSEHFASKILMDVLSEPCSHVAVEYTEGGIAYVIDSTLDGLRLQYGPKFHETWTVYDSISFPHDNLAIENCLSHEKAWYDIPAYCYFVVRVILLKLIRIPLPKKNAWAQKNMFICTEIAGFFMEDLKEDLAMSTPFQLLQFLKITKEGANATQKRV